MYDVSVIKMVDKAKGSLCNIRFKIQMPGITVVNCANRTFGAVECNAEARSYALFNANSNAIIEPAKLFTLLSELLISQNGVMMPPPANIEGRRYLLYSSPAKGDVPANDFILVSRSLP